MVDDVANPIKRQLKLWNPMISGCLSTSDSLLNLWYSHPTTTSCATHWCLVHWTSLTTIDRKQWVFPSEKWEASWKSPFGLVWQRNCLVAIHHFFLQWQNCLSAAAHMFFLYVYIYNELNSYNILYENINIYYIHKMYRCAYAHRIYTSEIILIAPAIFRTRPRRWYWVPLDSLSSRRLIHLAPSLGDSSVWVPSWWQWYGGETRGMGNHWKIIPKISIYTNLLQDDYPMITHVIYIYIYVFIYIFICDYMCVCL